MRAATPGLVESWEIRKMLLTEFRSDEPDYMVVGKADGEVQLAQNSREEGVKLVVRSYKPENIFIHDTGGPIARANPERTVATISQDEYYGRTEPSPENVGFIEVIKGTLLKWN